IGADDQPQIAAHHPRLRRILAERAQLSEVLVVHRAAGRTDITVAEAGGAARRGGAETADPDGRIRLLHGPRRQSRIADAEVLAAEVHGLALPQAADNFERFVGPRALAFEVDA